ncbi:cell wall hydrolase [Sphingobium sp. SCG-1]|uniref:cell wall hydrolase n=1 Tax=Sphingobium sp. SCG-1 TaxID=2072936 RepID=UPI000CD68624|nr:cell wall hydrolase [Sphingobium sp. SCG-1]AUW57468.1 cell wall hydrolase [Sphingobium sp. SCG-1]
MRLRFPLADRQAASKRFSWIGLAALCLALLTPHLTTYARMGALDLISDSAAAEKGHEAPTDNFPGSAFFYSEGAFDPIAEASTLANVHILALSNGPAASAAPFHARSALDQYRAVNCLTSAIYYEAGNERDAGQRAVAQVVLNRVRHPAWPQSVCGVVYQGSERLDTRCQFTFSCDGAMTRVPNSRSWARARRIAMDALAGRVFTPVGLATHYHTLAVKPGWSNSLTPVAVVGAHIFYRLPGANGTSRAFFASYSGREMQGGPARRSYESKFTAMALVAPILALPTPTSSTPALTARGPEDELPRSTIRAEFQNSGKPLS